MTAALAGTMASNVFYLTMSSITSTRSWRSRSPCRSSSERAHAGEGPSSSPRRTRVARRVAGLFVADAVEHLRAAGSRSRSCRRRRSATSGSRTAHGIVGNLRAAPWQCLTLPAFLVASSAPRGARRATPTSCTRTGSPSGLAARSREAVRAPGLGDGRRARAGACRGSRGRIRAPRAARDRSVGRSSRRRPSGSARGEVRVIPNGFELPEQVGEPDEPPHVLFAGPAVARRRGSSSSSRRPRGCRA